MKKREIPSIRSLRLLLPVIALAGAGYYYKGQVSVDPLAASDSLANRATKPLALREKQEHHDKLERANRLVELGKRSITISNDAGGPSSLERIPSHQWTGSAWDKDPDPALDAFAKWTHQFLADPDSASAATLEEGLMLAEQRREVLAGLIQDDPRRALAVALPDDIRGQLPGELLPFIEHAVDGFGNLVTEYQCGDRPSSRILAEVHGKTYQASTYGERMNLNHYLGSSIHGVALDDRIAILDGPIRVTKKEGETTRFLVGDKEYTTKDPGYVGKLEPVLASADGGGKMTLEEALASKGLDTTYGDTIYAMGDSGLSAAIGYPKRLAQARTHGAKNILILRLQSTNGGFPTAETPAVFSNWSWASNGWDARLRLTTYNKTWLNSVDVTPILTLPNPDSYYVYTNSSNQTVYDSGRWANDGEAAALSAGFNAANYDCVVVCTKDYPNGGFAWASGKRIWVNGKFGNFAALMNHEYGHVLGLPHASSWTASDGNPISPNRVSVEYGDENDPMGNGGKMFRNTYQAYLKNLQQWMPDSAVSTITANGTYTVYQDDGATSLNRTLALKVGRDREIMYWLSIRGDLQPYTENGVTRNQAEFMNGVSIVAVTPWANPYTLDLNNPNDNNRANTPLALNQTWYDSAADITFKTVEVGGTNPNLYAKVQVTFGHKYNSGYRPLVSGASYRFKNRHNNQYLTVPGNSSANAVALTAAALNTADDSQVWVAWRQSDGSYQFNHRGTDKWIDVQSNSANDGATIWQYTYSTSNPDSQKFNVFQTETESLFLLHRGTEGKLIEMDLNNQKIHQMRMTSTNWQQWIPEFVGISPGTYRIVPMHAERQGLTVENGGTGDGPAATRIPYDNLAHQRWVVSDLDNGRIRLAPAHIANKALDISNSGSANGTRIQQWNWNQTVAQRWTFSRITGQWLRFTPDCAPSACIDAYGNTPDSSAVLWNFTSGVRQHWRFADYQ